MMAPDSKSPHTQKYRVAKMDGTPLPEGEPVFVLRGQDVFAAEAVQGYRRLLGLAGYDGAFLDRITEHIEEMKAWRPQKRPD